jgi:hypothetical protein
MQLQGGRQGVRLMAAKGRGAKAENVKRRRKKRAGCNWTIGE